VVELDGAECFVLREFVAVGDVDRLGTVVVPLLLYEVVDGGHVFIIASSETSRTREGTMKLRVHDAYKDDVYKDTIRVHRSGRNEIKTGTIVRVTVEDTGERSLVVIRGLGNNEKGQIFLDLETRRRLGVEVGDEQAFSFTPVWFVGQILWAYRATEPSVRVGTWPAVWSAFLAMALGLVGLLVGVWL
jgi:hypothetical protein